MADDADVASAIAELDDSYLKVMLLLAVRRANSDEPRRAGLWHALAVLFAEEQEKRRRAAELVPGAASPNLAAVERHELDAVLAELRAEQSNLEAEVRESTGDLAVAGD